VTSGELRQGDKLPPERELAQSLNVSRMAVREAFRTLESAGLITLQRGALGGAFISGGDATLVTQTLQDLVTLGSVSIDDLTEARICLMEPIIRLACRRVSDDDLRRLQENVEHLATVLGDDQHEERFACAMEFNRILGASTNNAILRILVDALNGISHDVLAPFMREQKDTVLRDALLRSRRAFVRHMCDRNADAAAAEMTRHLIELREHTVARKGARIPVGGPTPRRAASRR
jgi:DNA-binding FadR family transcriptional regulator